MRIVFIRLITLCLSMSLLQAESLNATIESQALEIKQLKRALSLKEQELKILLITLKNSKQESMLHSTQQHLEFQDVSNVSPTRVVVKSSTLSESAIKEIDNIGDTDTDALDDTLNNQDASGETQAGSSTAMMTQKGHDTESSKMDESQSIIDESMIDKETAIPALTRMKPSTFSLIKDTKVTKKIFDKEGESWREGMRFTSNKRRGTWIQITGRITDQGWKQVHGTLWINQSSVKKIR